MKWLKDHHNQQIRLTSEQQEHIKSDHLEMFGQIGRVQDTPSNPDPIIRSRTDHAPGTRRVLRCIKGGDMVAK